jgi:hypothetical protein
MESNQSKPVNDANIGTISSSEQKAVLYTREILYTSRSCEYYASSIHNRGRKLKRSFSTLTNQHGLALQLSATNKFIKTQDACQFLAWLSISENKWSIS